MERTIPQRRWSNAGDTKPAAPNGRCMSARSSALPQIASRPKSAVASSRTPQGCQSLTSLEHRSSSFPRERPKSAFVQPLSGRTSVKTVGTCWYDNGSTTSMSCQDNYSDQDTDFADTFGDDKNTSLQDLLTCSALNVETKARKPDWNVSDPVMPKFHCPRCRDHWYGLTPSPCDYVQARLSRGVWHTDQAGVDKGEERPRALYRSKSARVRHISEGRQNNAQLFYNEPSNGSDVSLIKKGNSLNPAQETNRSVAFKPTISSKESNGGVDIDSAKGNNGEDDCDHGDHGTGGIEHQKSIHDDTNKGAPIHDDTIKGAPLSESLESCNRTAPLLEQTKVHYHIDALPSNRDGTCLPGTRDRNPQVGIQEAEVIPSHGNGGPATIGTFILSKDKTELPSLPMEINLSLTGPNREPSQVHLNMTVINKQGFVNCDDVVPSHTTPSDTTRSASSSLDVGSSQTTPSIALLSTSTTFPPPRSAQGTTKSTDSRSLTVAPLLQGNSKHSSPVRPMLLRRHTVDASDFIHGFKVTSPWTFSYHNKASSPKKTLGKHRPI